MLLRILISAVLLVAAVAGLFLGARGYLITRRLWR